MSSAARAAASRWTRAGLARTQPIRNPAQNVLLIEPIVIAVSEGGRGHRRGRVGAVEVEAGDRLVDDQRRADVRASATSCSRSAAGIVNPVGFWLSAIT